MFQCRYPRCGKSFSVKSNCPRHELNECFPGHQKEEFPLQRKRRAVTPFFDNNLRVCYCPRAECKMSSGKKSNVQQHIENNCLSKMQQRDKINKNKVCTICNMTFTQKLNRDRHVPKLHKDEIGNNSPLGSVTSDE